MSLNPVLSTQPESTLTRQHTYEIQDERSIASVDNHLPSIYHSIGNLRALRVESDTDLTPTHRQPMRQDQYPV